MINFRFHVLSLTAIFVALAVGLLVGTAALDGPVADGVRAELGTERARTDQLRDQVDQLTADATTREEFAEQLAPFVLADRLGAKRVLVVAVGADPADVDGVAAMLRVARATVVGPVTITDRFVDPLRAQELLDTALTALSPSVSSGLPATTDGVTASAALLAAVLVRRTPPVTADDRRSVLTAYTDLGYLAGVDPSGPPADAVVVVGGPATGAGTPVLLRAVVELDRAGPLVVVGGEPVGTDLVGAVRADPSSAASASTVDSIGTPHGKLVVAWAVADQLAGTVGHYGTGTGLTLLPRSPS